MAGAFLFGKMPTLGDFVCRGMTTAQRAAWDGRCISVLADVRDQEQLEATAPRGFLLHPTVNEPFWQLGCVAPSCDRVGREFLLIFGIASEAGWGQEWRMQAARLEPCLRLAITRGVDVEAALELIEVALVSDEAGEIETMEGWRTGWLGASVTANGRDE